MLKYYNRTKTRSVSQIHSIWLKANQRSLYRRNLFNEFINNIPNLIKPDSEGVYHLYYELNNQIYVINLDFKGHFGGWSYNTSRLDKDKNRDTILQWWLSEDSITNLGLKFYELENDRGFKLDGISRKALDDSISEHFRMVFKNKIPPESFITTINNIDYIVIVENRFNYSKFKLSNPVETPIKI